MGRKTNISYATATWSGWRGCTHAGVGCENCFAEAMAKRNPTVLGQWGPQGTRVVAAPQYWWQPLAWSRTAACCCRKTVADHEHDEGCPQKDRPRVLWDLSDVFEDWRGVMVHHDGCSLWKCDECGVRMDGALPSAQGQHGPYCQKCSRETLPLTMTDVRRDAYHLADSCQNLDFLWLTKRPQNIRPMWSAYSGAAPYKFAPVTRRENVWLGCSCSTQHDLDQMVPHLLACRDLAPVLWLSLEPLLGPINLHNALHPPFPQVDWVVIGGESGPNARPCNVQWIRDIVRQCREAGIACYTKQIGSRAMRPMSAGGISAWCLRDRKGGDIAEWDEDLRVREFPNVNR